MNTASAPPLNGSLPVVPVVGEIETFLQEVMRLLEPDAAEQRRSGPGRPLILPTVCLWGGLLVCLVRGFTSQTAIWRLLTFQGLWTYPRFALSDQAVFKRLATEGTQFLERLFVLVRTMLADRIAPYAFQGLAPWATAVLALDETTLDPWARRLPGLRHRSPGDPELLPGKLAGIFDVRRQQWQHVQYLPDAQQNEKVAAWELVEHTPLGSLILADLGYFGFAWFDHLTDLKRWWVSRLRAKTSYQVLHTYYQDAQVFDGLVWLGAYRADRAKHSVRLVQFPVGEHVYRYITNVLDPHQLTLREMAQLYARRWDFELAVNLVKTHLRLHLLWSSKLVVMLQHIWAVLIIAQILHALQMEIAGRAGVDPFDVSLQLLVEYAPQYAYEGKNVVTIFVEQGRELGFIRPSTRTKVRAPTIPLDEITPCPPDLVLVRSAR